MSSVTSTPGESSSDRTNTFTARLSADPDVYFSTEKALECDDQGVTHTADKDTGTGPTIVSPDLGVYPVESASPYSGDLPELSVSSLLQALPSGVVILDNGGRVSNANPAAGELLGDEVQGLYWRDVIARTFEPQLDDGHEVSLKNGLKVSLQTRSLQGGAGQLIVINDLTETRKLQTSLSRHQRLSSMGKMMSSLAHQIRTPLSAALLHADNLLNQHEGESRVAQRSQKIISRLHNIERQIRDMLIFARGGTAVTGSTTGTAIVARMRESAADMLAHHDGNVTWLDSSEGVRLNCNMDALIGAFLNLLENALQANSDNAPIRVCISVQGADTEYQDYLLNIEVINQGAELDPGTLKSLQEPFTTTKANGNGLGLAIVRLVCQSHHGKFDLDSHSNQVIARMQIPASFTGADQ